MKTQEEYEMVNAAHELVSKFLGLTTRHKRDKAGNDGFINAKKCATIVCNEIINQYIDKRGFTAEYYKAVKNIIKEI